MNKQKVFQLKEGSAGDWALKGQAHKHTSGNTTRIKVVFAVNGQMQVVAPSILANGNFVSSTQLVSEGESDITKVLDDFKESGKALYYRLSEMNYICQQNLVLEGSQLVKNSLSIYIPVEGDESGVSCADITIQIPPTKREEMAQTYLKYTVDRV
jgi:hypothetical protein